MRIRWEVEHGDNEAGVCARDVIKLPRAQGGSKSILHVVSVMVDRRGGLSLCIEDSQMFSILMMDSKSRGETGSRECYLDVSSPSI